MESLKKDLDKQLKVGKFIRDLINSKTMPTEMQEQIGEYYSELCKVTATKDMAVATRSSGAVSMPGQMETYLNVRGENNVIKKIMEVRNGNTQKSLYYTVEI